MDSERLRIFDGSSEKILEHPEKRRAIAIPKIVKLTFEYHTGSRFSKKRKISSNKYFLMGVIGDRDYIFDKILDIPRDSFKTGG
jgi:hypothetical protein